MKVSISWLKELINLNCSTLELVALLPLRTIGIKEVTDQFIELDMKGYNRADLLSMLGIANEVSAITGSNKLFNELKEANFAWNKQSLPLAKVSVENPELTPFYTITKIEGLRVGKSEADWVKKLADSGIRSINNIADVTNLVMLEYGQPLHAFDADKVEGMEIVVRVAKENEEITTLDGKKRELTSTDLLITDPKKPIGLAGVMGGENTEVTENTNTILLEAAIFDPVSIRKTATNLGLPSEASKRFQHGLTKTRLLQALDKAIKMYTELGGKVTAQVMIGDFEDKVKKITLTQKKLEELVGVRFEKSKVEEYLKALGFTLNTKGETLRAWEVTVPYWRLDVNIEEDVIEEVARMYGYEKIPAAKVSESKPLQEEDPIFRKIADLKNKLADLGLTEVQTYSFYSTKVMTALGFNNSNKDSLVKIENPISSETEYLRDSLWPNLVEIVDRNIRKGHKDVAVFEIGKIFNNIDGEPTESYKLAITLSNGTNDPLQELLALVHQLELVSESQIKQTTPLINTKDLFHPKRFISLEEDGKQIGSLAEVHLRVLNKLGIEKRVAVLEIQLS